MRNEAPLTMKIDELAKTLGICRYLAYSLARQDALPVPVIRLGGKRMCVSRKAVSELLDRQHESEGDSK